MVRIIKIYCILINVAQFYILTMNINILNMCISADRPDPPSKPLVSEVTEDSCRLDWQAPSHDGGASIVSYTIHKCEGCVGEKWERVTSSHLTHVTVRRLKENKQYR